MSSFTRLVETSEVVWTTVKHGAKPPGRLDAGVRAPPLSAIDLPLAAQTIADGTKAPKRLDAGVRAPKSTAVEVPLAALTTAVGIDEGAGAPESTAIDMLGCMDHRGGKAPRGQTLERVALDRDNPQEESSEAPLRREGTMGPSTGGGWRWSATTRRRWL